MKQWDDRVAAAQVCAGMSSIFEFLGEKHTVEDASRAHAAKIVAVLKSMNTWPVPGAASSTCVPKVVANLLSPWLSGDFWVGAWWSLGDALELFWNPSGDSWAIPWESSGGGLG